MNPIDHQLQRLFRAAAQAKPEPTLAPPYGLETRVVAAWREAELPGLWEMAPLVRGLILASLIMGVSLWVAVSNNTNPYSDYLQLADSTVQPDN